MNDEYTKISWEDGTVIKKATVNINGTEYEVEPELISGTTPINSTNLNHMDDGIKGLYDKHLINKTVIELIAVSENEPEEFITGNKYYNLLNNLIYTAISDSSWSENGEEPVSTYLYVDLNDSKLYYYDGTNFKAYGGGSGGKTSEEVIISDEQPTGDDWKLWIPNDEVEQLSEVVDSLDGDYTNVAPSVRVVKEKLNKMLTIKKYTLTINETYVYSSDLSYTCIKIGNYAILNIQSIAFKSSAPHSSVILRGLPKPKNAYTIFALTGNLNAAGTGVRLTLDGNGVASIFYGSPSKYGDSANSQYTGTFVYETTDIAQASLLSEVDE